jgi:tetratricopeptide (TPR) repeat protein/energy-coupling factor transporter ATP-binding protein EcfA2
MSEDALFPAYIHRDEERLIVQEAEQVKADGRSRAVLLYGPGGSGKTTLVRELARLHTSTEQTVWLNAIDVDDPEYWLLSNLEQYVALQLDQERQFFGPYFRDLSRTSAYAQSQPGAGVISRLGRVKRIFQECYWDFVRSTGKSVVVTMDTVETIRGMSLLLTLTQWMKALPATLFILSGRPQPDQDAESDPIRYELEDPHLGMPVSSVWLGRFSQDASFEYLSGSSVRRGITTEERTKLALLAHGQPLWLAFTVSYLNEIGMPEEANVPLEEIQAMLPFNDEPPPQGQLLHEAFKRRLVAPYRDVDFWHEAIKRLAVARQSANQEIWQQLMADKRLPPDLGSWQEAWQRLLLTPWIRPRANSRYVTLHDAVAEELGKRIIPVHDQDVRWRQELWKRAAAIYAEATRGPGQELAAEQAELDRQLRDLDQVPGWEDEERRSAAAVGDFVAQAAALEVRKRDLDQLKAAGLTYQLLCDFEAGCEQYLDWLEEANRKSDVPFADLLTLEMQRLLPGKFRYPLGDVVGDVVADFHRWLAARPRLHREIGLSTAGYLIEHEQPTAAKDLLESLPDTDMEFDHSHQLSILLGNSSMRIAGQARHGLAHFRRALAEASELRPPECYRYIADAQNELGFFYRHQGMWRDADSAYREALGAIADSLAVDTSDEVLEEMASIQTNWAYVKGLEGFYRAGANLVESAIEVRHRLGNRQGEAISQSVCGEVYRYERRFELAWRAYEQAQEIFHEQLSWPWLGILYQEQAICLFQAIQDDVVLIGDRDQLAQAKRLITLALDICHDFERGYPSALNRAGRIFGQEDHDRGLEYLRLGIDAAKALSDGWFWFANLIEYAELSYAAWLQTGNPAYRDEIGGRATEVRQAAAQYHYPDLRGRWFVVQGNLQVRDWQADHDVRHLDEALDLYTRGFALIAEGYMGSSGAAAIPGQFKAFRRLLHELPQRIRLQWLQHLRQEWGALSASSDLLLAKIAVLY